EHPLLAAIDIEVLRREPRVEAAPDRRPLVVGDRVPRRVAVASLDHLVLAEDALEREPEALGRPPRGGVERVALPLEAAVAEVIERVAREQVDRLAGRGRALEREAEPDMADLDDTELGRDAQVGGEPERALAWECREREE